jgi:hypothetical protein
MSSRDSFGKGFLERFDRIALMQATERRRNPKRAGTHLVDSVAPRAIKLRQASTLLDVGGFHALGRSQSENHGHR